MRSGWRRSISISPETQSWGNLLSSTKLIRIYHTKQISRSSTTSVSFTRLQSRVRRRKAWLRSLSSHSLGEFSADSVAPTCSTLIRIFRPITLSNRRSSSTFWTAESSLFAHFRRFFLLAITQDKNTKSGSTRGCMTQDIRIRYLKFVLPLMKRNGFRPLIRVMSRKHLFSPCFVSVLCCRPERSLQVALVSLLDYSRAPCDSFS
ncbi:hypothetical protein R3P38DRAFT_595682 [Favolaschia claudopus]|uniref:Uncharacterized protein n=1 Tax=Favolaschia claudopus TaxID=2862362 RepID=A0AAV9Z8R6_9AGAR